MNEQMSKLVECNYTQANRLDTNLPVLDNVVLLLCQNQDLANLSGAQ